VLQGHTQSIWLVGFSPDGQILVSGSVDQTVKLWTIANGQCQKTLTGHSDWVASGCSFSLDGQTLISASFDQTIKLWDVLTGECCQTLRGHTGRIWTIALSPDGHTLASGAEDCTVRLWNLTTKISVSEKRQDWGRVFSGIGVSLSTRFSPYL
jgi:WD40 repeat protein